MSIKIKAQSDTFKYLVTNSPNTSNLQYNHVGDKCGKFSQVSRSNLLLLVFWHERFNQNNHNQLNHSSALNWTERSSQIGKKQFDTTYFFAI